MNIVEGNVKIAKYLGWRIDNSFPDKNKVWRSPEGLIELDTTLKFHTSFDYLIPIRAKINSEMIESFIPFTGSKEELWQKIVDNIT